MSAGIGGNYDGEGPNVAAKSTTAPGPVASSPDTWAKRGPMNNGITGGQGIGGWSPWTAAGASGLRTKQQGVGRPSASAAATRSSACAPVGSTLPRLAIS